MCVNYGSHLLYSYCWVFVFFCVWVYWVSVCWCGSVSFFLCFLSFQAFSVFEFWILNDPWLWHHKKREIWTACLSRLFLQKWKYSKKKRGVDLYFIWICIYIMHLRMNFFTILHKLDMINVICVAVFTIIPSVSQNECQLFIWPYSVWSLHVPVIITKLNLFPLTPWDVFFILSCYLVSAEPSGPPVRSLYTDSLICLRISANQCCPVLTSQRFLLVYSINVFCLSTLI